MHIIYSLYFAGPCFGRRMLPSSGSVLFEPYNHYCLASMCVGWDYSRRGYISKFYYRREMCTICYQLYRTSYFDVCLSVCVDPG